MFFLILFCVVLFFFYLNGFFLSFFGLVLSIMGFFSSFFGSNEGTFSCSQPLMLCYCFFFLYILLW